MTAALDPVTLTLADMQTHLRTHKSFDDPAGPLARIGATYPATRAPGPQRIDTVLLFHHPCGQPLKPVPAWLTRKCLGRTIQDRGPGGHDPEENARARIDLLKAKIKNCASLCNGPDDIAN